MCTSDGSVVVLELVARPMIMCAPSSLHACAFMLICVLEDVCSSQNILMVFFFVPHTHDMGVSCLTRSFKTFQDIPLGYPAAALMAPRAQSCERPPHSFSVHSVPWPAHNCELRTFAGPDQYA